MGSTIGSKCDSLIAIACKYVEITLIISKDKTMQKSELIQKLREHSCVRGKQRTWVSELSDDQLYNIFQMLKRGQTAKSIAAFIQMKWKIKTNSTAHSLSQGILKFRGRITELLSLKPDKSNESIDYEDIKRDPPMESLLKNELIASNYRRRIERMLEEERELGVSYPTLSKDVQSLTSFERVIMKQRDTLIKHQSNDPVRHYQNSRTENKDLHIVGQLINQIDDREKVAQALHQIVEKIRENDDFFVLSEDGSTLMDKEGNILNS